MARTADRPVPVGPRRARARRWPSAARSPRCRSCCCRSRSTCSRRRWRCPASWATCFVYTVWLKRRTPQNIVIGGAAGAVPPLVGWAAVDGLAVGHVAVPVRDRLLLDAAALLGAVAAHEGRVREGRRADAAGRARRGRDAPPDPALHACCSTRSRSCRSAPAASACSTSSPRWCSARRSSAARVLLARRADRRSALRLYLFSLAYLAAAVRGDGGRRPAFRLPTPWTATSPARTSAPASSSPPSCFFMFGMTFVAAAIYIS